jgi:hypothetical protein
MLIEYDDRTTKVIILHLLDRNGINTRALYIRSAANVWVDLLNKHLYSDEW